MDEVGRVAKETSKRLLPLSRRKVMGLDQVMERQRKRGLRDCAEVAASALMWGLMFPEQVAWWQGPWSI